MEQDWSFGNPASMGDGIRAGEQVGAATELLDEAWWFPAIQWPDGRMQFMLNERMMPSQFIVNGEGQAVHQRGRAVHGLRSRHDRRARGPGSPTFRAGLSPITAPSTATSSAAICRYPRSGRAGAHRAQGAAGLAGVGRGQSGDELGRAGDEDRGAAGQLRDTAARFNELARKGHDDDFNRGDSVYDNYYGDPTLPNPNLYPLGDPPYYAFRDRPRRSRAHRVACAPTNTPGCCAPTTPWSRALRGGQHLGGGDGPQLRRGRGHHRPGHDLRLRRGQTLAARKLNSLNCSQEVQMKISLFYEFALPRPWGPDDEHVLLQDCLDEVEAADKAGFSTVWLTEHHFLEEYCHSSAPEMFLAAASQRTKNIRLGFGVMHLPPAVNHPARVAERIATLDLLSNGRVEFGTGESSSVGELGGFDIDPADKRAQWEEALEVAIRCMIEEPFTGFKGEHIEMPARNVIPKPLQKPHPPVWVACTRPASVQMAAQKAIGALSFAYTGPGPLTERVNGYYKEFEENGVPVTPAINPNILAIGGDLSMMVAAPTRRHSSASGIGRRILLVRDHALLHDRHAHPRTDRGVEALSRRGREGPDAGLRPRTRRDRLTGHRAGVPARLRGERRRRDHPAAQPAQPRGHHGIHRADGQRGPAGVHRARRKGGGRQGQAARAGHREGRGAPAGVDRAAVRRNLRLRRPAHRSRGKFTASEIPEAMAEINEGRVQAAQRAKEQREKQS